MPATAWESRWLPDLKKKFYLWTFLCSSANEAEEYLENYTLQEIEEHQFYRLLEERKTYSNNENQEIHSRTVPFPKGRGAKGQAKKSAGWMPWH